jgi:glycine cleavage system H protein
MVPEALYYSKDHEWLRVEGGEATVGITDYAQKELGDIVYLEFPEAGRKLKAGEELGTVESVKAVSEIYAPVGGEVLEVNESLTADPDRSAVVNQDPYGEGWLVKLRLSDPEEVKGLLDAEGYQRFLQEAAD